MTARAAGGRLLGRIRSRRLVDQLKMRCIRGELIVYEARHHTFRSRPFRHVALAWPFATWPERAKRAEARLSIDRMLSGLEAVLSAPVTRAWVANAGFGRIGSWARVWSGAALVAALIGTASHMVLGDALAVAYLAGPGLIFGMALAYRWRWQAFGQRLEEQFGGLLKQDGSVENLNAETANTILTVAEQRGLIGEVSVPVFQQAGLLSWSDAHERWSNGCDQTADDVARVADGLYLDWTGTLPELEAAARAVAALPIGA